MRILYLAHVRLPTEKAHGAQIVKTCEALGSAGDEVTLLIPRRPKALPQDPFDYYDAKRTFTIVELPVPDFIPLGPLGFAFSLLWFSEAAKWRKEFSHAEVIYSRDAFVLLQYVLLGRRMVYEAHTRPTFISRLVASMVSRLVTISEGLARVYEDAGIPRARIAVAPDAIDLVPFEKTYDVEKVRAELGMPLQKKIALYVGKIDEAKGTTTFAHASEFLPEDIAAVMVGEGKDAQALARRFSKALFLPATPYRDLARVLSTADVLVLPNSAKDANASRYTSPLKAFGYLASGKPIVASDVPALREVFNERNAFFAHPDDPKALARTIEEALSSTDTNTRASKAKENAKAFSWDARAKMIQKALTS